MNRKQRLIVSVTGIFLVLLILVGLTYAYFLTKIKGNDNEKSISVTTADLKLEYSDINDILVSEENVEPGNSWTKTFAVTNNGNKTVTNYGVALENIENGLERKEDLVYTLTCTQYTKATYKVENKVASGTTSGTCNGVSSETTYPSVGTILVENSIDTDKVQAYTLTVTYKETNTDQSIDMNKRFSGKVNIVDPKLFGPFGTDTLASTIINTAKNQTDDKNKMGYAMYRETPSTKIGESIIYYNGNVINKEVSEAGYTYDSLKVANSLEDAKDFNNLIDTDNTKCVSDQINKYLRLGYGPTNPYNAKIVGCENGKYIIQVEDRSIESSLSVTEDDYGTSYYFRGNVIDNYVNFANLTWRIVRINGDGTLRLILDDVAKDSSGNVIKTAFNTTAGDNAYVGYMYGTPGSTTYDATHENKNNSTIKVAVDKWYEDNLKTNYSNYLADTLFCGDKTLAEDGIGGVTTQLGYGKNETYYSSIERLQYSTGTTDITTLTPTFKCAEKANDNYSRYTTTKSILPNGKETNGDLKYPIGLLTADEVAYAGAYKESKINKTYYLYNSSITSYWWLSSPNFYYGSFAYWWRVNGSGGYIRDNFHAVDIADSSVAFRPTINLKKDIKFTGTGTSGDPYKIVSE